MNCGSAAKDHAIYRRYVAYYYALVSEIDHHIGAVLDELKRLGLADNTIVIYASDHGDFVAGHGMVEKCAVGHNVYEDTLHVPMMFRWPGRFKAGAVRDDLTSLIDLYPTILDLAGIKHPAAAKKLDPSRGAPDEFVLSGTEVFLSCPGGYGETKLSNDYFERCLGVTCTTRNWKTVNALLELAASPR